MQGQGNKQMHFITSIDHIQFYLDIYGEYSNFSYLLILSK